MYGLEATLQRQPQITSPFWRTHTLDRAVGRTRTRNRLNLTIVQTGLSRIFTRDAAHFSLPGNPRQAAV